MSVVLKTPSGGSVTLSPENTASNFTFTVPAGSGVVTRQGPSFLAHRLTNVSISSSTDTRLAFPTEVYDTDSCYNNTGSTVNNIPAYAFKPTVAGYYQFSASCNYEQSVSCVRALITLSKSNDTAEVHTFRLDDVSRNTGNINGAVSGSTLMYLNGTTEYAVIEMYIQASTATIVGNPLPDFTTYFTGVFVRAT